MPVHDWTRVNAGILHAFHLAWLAEMSKSVNNGLLSTDFYALVEQHIDGMIPDVLAKGKRRTLVIRHVSGHRIVALVEVVSPANKDRKRHVIEFTNKACTALQLGIHLLLIDLLPPSPYDPSGMHGAVWERLGCEEPYDLPVRKPLTLAAYAAAKHPTAYIDHLAVGDDLPVMPLFLMPKRFVDLPLEPSYDAAYQGMPLFWRRVIEGKQPAP